MTLQQGGAKMALKNNLKEVSLVTAKASCADIAAGTVLQQLTWTGSVHLDGIGPSLLVR